MNLEDITVVILTYNEAPNVGRTLRALDWARRVLVVDSCSTDGTGDIAGGHPGVRVVQRPFDTHTLQWNFALSLVETGWVLALDADYLVPPEFAAELGRMNADVHSAWYAGFRYCIFGEPIRGNLYPPRAVLFQRTKCRYVDDGHTQLLEIDGSTGVLETRIDHDDRKGLDRWVADQVRYAGLEADKLSKSAVGSLGWADRIRKTLVLGPFLVFFYTLLVKGTILDGWRGWYYVFQRTLAEMLLSLRMLERQFIGRGAAETPGGHLRPERRR